MIVLLLMLLPVQFVLRLKCLLYKNCTKTCVTLAGVRWLAQYVCAKNLLFLMEDVKRTFSFCQVSTELKSQFYIPQKDTLIKATQFFEQTAIDFKGPLPTYTQNMYLLVIVNEFSQFPFCYPCPNMHSETIIKCLNYVVYPVVFTLTMHVVSCHKR